MSRTVRFAAALVILAALTSASLEALPPSFRTIPAETGRGDFLTAVVEWIVSLLTPNRPAGEVPQPAPQSKESSGLDPYGGH